MKTLVVIPARWNSSRFPGKPLAIIAGQPLLGRVVDLARRATATIASCSIVIATDDQRIADVARDLGVAAVLTDPRIGTGTERALAAARMVNGDHQMIVNLQGDAPFAPPSAVGALIEALAKGADVATPLIQLSWDDVEALRRHKAVVPFSGTTCIRASDGDAVWFSKQIIPAMRNSDYRDGGSTLSPIFRHIGMYGYDIAALTRFAQLAPSHYEGIEGLEQLRFLENGIPIKTVLVEQPSISLGGIDSVQDVTLAEAFIARHGDPFGT